MLSSMVSDGAEFGTAAKELMRRKRDGKPFTKSELGTIFAAWQKRPGSATEK